jgi:DNA-binding response OmpR family regulator
MTPSYELSAEGRRILIVDDEPDNRELLQIVLTWDGFATQTAASGEEALASAVEHPPDLVLLDLMMPGLDGCQVTTLMKQNLVTKNIPVMIISAMNDRATKLRVLSAGAAEFISKPIDRSDLCARVRAVLGPKAAPA